MPQYGSGIIPNSGAVTAELNAATRRAYSESVIVQFLSSSPMMCALLSNALTASGGLSPITQPVQGSPMVQSQWTNYSGTFNQPSPQQGISNAEFNLAANVTPIPFPGFEGLVQLNYDVVPLIEARMNDATSETIYTFQQALWNNITNSVQMNGLPLTVDDGTQAATYGGLARNAINSLNISWWKSTYVSNSAAAVTPTRDLIMQYQSQIFKQCGEKPKMGVCGVGTWTQLTRDFTPNERYNTDKGGAYGEEGNTVNALFDALEVAGVPIYADPACPEGTLYELNTDYMSLYLHERAAFTFTGFEPLLSNNQFGYIGALLTLAQLVNVKPITHGKFANLNFLPI